MASEEEFRKEHEEREFEDSRIVYKALLEDIRFYKNQQWLTTYYVFGIYVVFSTLLSQQSHRLGFCFIIFISILILLVMVVGIRLLWIYQNELVNSRNTKVKVMDYLSPVIVNMLEKERKGNPFPEIFTYLTLAMIIGGIFVYFLALSKLF